jgi:ornithine cyclodeaminase
MPGCHVDLVGAFNMAMREVDDAALHRASLFVDTPAALVEGGDIAIAIRDGAITAEAVKGDLARLCAGGATGRRDDDQITLFKSIGASIEDLAAARLVWSRLSS